jgi:DNA-binding beta-propeller fold protein YncE
MKQFIFVLACLMLLSAEPLIAAPNAPASGLDWSVKQTWKLTTEPLDFVQSLDNKKVFVLGADSKVHIFTPQGAEIGSIPVNKDVTAIDIAPRGEMLYLISKTGKSYTALDISVTQKIDITGAPFLGNENAPVALIVFSDFQ